VGFVTAGEVVLVVLGVVEVMGAEAVPAAGGLSIVERTELKTFEKDGVFPCETVVLIELVI